MPPRAKGRRYQLKPDPKRYGSPIYSCPASNSSRRKTVRLPQELVDAIIDELDSKDERVYQKTLRSCALVAPAFVAPCQRKLFSTVDMSAGPDLHRPPPDKRIESFSKILSRNPHMGSYVHHLLLAHRSPWPKSVDHILSSLPRLKTLSLQAKVHRYTRNWCHPGLLVHHRDALLGVFPLPSLRRIEFRNHEFRNAF